MSKSLVKKLMKMNLFSFGKGEFRLDYISVSNNRLHEHVRRDYALNRARSKQIFTDNGCSNVQMSFRSFVVGNFMLEF